MTWATLRGRLPFLNRLCKLCIDQAVTARDEVSGVSLDQEAADLIRFSAGLPSRRQNFASGQSVV